MIFIAVFLSSLYLFLGTIKAPQFLIRGALKIVCNGFLKKIAYLRKSAKKFAEFTKAEIISFQIPRYAIV